MATFHIIAGLLTLVFGTLALAAAKGGALHRKSGTLFVYTIMLLTSSGLGAFEQVKPLNMVGSVLTFYLVATGLLTVLRPSGLLRGISFAALGVAVGNGLWALSLATQAAAPGKAEPKSILFVFATVTLLAAAGDAVILVRGVAGTGRIVRHLWRMGLAMGILTMAGARLVPESMRQPGLLAAPAVLVLAAVLYSLGKVLLAQRSARA